MQYREQLHLGFKLIPTYCFCNVSVAPLRAEPTHKAEMVTQMLYGEKAKVLEVTPSDWAFVRCGWDGYEGWCKLSQLTEISHKQFEKLPKLISTTHNGRFLMDEESVLMPMGSVFDKMTVSSRGGPVMKFKGKKAAVSDLKPDGISEKALSFLHTPYLWGGRTAAGIDCSGLTQMVYKMCGIAIPRDASQQVNIGQLVDFLEVARCGDLAFFHNDEDRITHVGMLLDSQTIIHATEIAGRVVVDRIDPGGIISVSLKKRTHALRVIKRVL